MSFPTVYFPKVKYKLDQLAMPRRWSTQINDSPGGARQKRALWTYNKRMYRATVFTQDGTSKIVGVADSFETVRRFLDAMKGEFGTFWMFNPKTQNFDHALDPRQTNCGPFNTTFPQVCPFAGGTISTIYADGVVYKTVSQFTTDSGGPGGETRITAVSGANPANGQIISVDVTGAQERFAACLTGDVDNFALDPEAADPVPELTITVQEEFVV